MATGPFVGEIRIFAGNFAPAGWMFCEGQILPIDPYEQLFTLIGTTYGGDGQRQFALPDLRGRIPIHRSTKHPIGETGGVEEVTLTVQQMPSHTHPFQVSNNNASTANAAGNVVARTPTYTPFFAVAPSTPLDSKAAGPTGGSQPHENLQPFLCVHFIIAVEGVFPNPG